VVASNPNLSTSVFGTAKVQLIFESAREKLNFFQGDLLGSVSRGCFRETVPEFRLLPHCGPVRVNVTGIPEPFPLITDRQRIPSNVNN
jgi:hypothetical protein